MGSGSVGILSVGAGDTKLSFDKNNPAERIRAARIVRDMLRRGYALLIEVEEQGKKVYRRALDFDEDRCEYIIADFDPMQASEKFVTEVDVSRAPTIAALTQGENHVEKKTGIDQGPELPQGKKRGRPSKRVDAGKTNAVAVSRTAGG